MNNETLDRLRPLGAWVLLGAVGATLLAGLVRLIVVASDYTGGFAFGVESAASSFFGLWHVVLLAAAVALVVTSERTRPSAAPVVVTAMIMVGVGLLFAVISLITGFIVPENVGIGFAGFFTTLAQGGVLGLLGFVLLKVFNDPTLVPRATPQGQYHPQQPYGADQQPYAQPGYPAADPTQTGSGQVYGQDPAQAASGQQQGYAQYGQEAQPYDASAQQSYDAQQQGYAYGTGAQQAYGTGGQQAYDPSAQQSYDAQQQGYAYGTGAQQAYGTGGQQAYDAQQAAYGTGAQQPYDPSAQQGYGQQYGDASAQQPYAYGTGAQQSYDPSQYAQQYGQQDASAQAYDPAQYAPQSYDAPQGSEQAVSSGEQAAQDAIQYGWYQGSDQAQQAQDTPSDSGVDPFFNSGEQTGTDASGQSGASYGSQYEAGSGYGSDQQGQGNSGGQQGRYGGEGNR